MLLLSNWRIKLKLALILLLTAYSSGTMALSDYYATKIITNEPNSGDLFGYSVSVDGDTALIGAPSNTGAAYIFMRNVVTGQWTQHSQLVPQGRSAGETSSNDEFGISVALDGDTALIGARGDGEKGIKAGAAYVFVRHDTTWDYKEKLFAEHNDNIDYNYNYFGHSVSISGDSALIGAPNHAKDNGAAYLFALREQGWAPQTIFLGDSLGADYFGYSVSLSQDIAVVGAHRDNDNGYGNGSVSVFRFRPNEKSWTQEAELFGDETKATYDNFGQSVAIDGDTILVGATGDDQTADDAGAAYLFSYDYEGEEWVKTAKLVDDANIAYARMGVAVALHDDLAVVGTTHLTSYFDFSGVVFSYKLDNKDGIWKIDDELTSNNGIGDFFGQSVDVNHGVIAAGAFRDSIISESGGFFRASGSSHLFERDNDD